MERLNLVLLLILLALPLQVRAQDDVPLDRSAAFAQIVSVSSTLLTGLKSRELSTEEFKDYISNITGDLYMQGFITLAQLNERRGLADTCVEAELQVRNPPPMDQTEYKDDIGDDEGNMRFFRYQQWLRERRDKRCGAAVDFNSLSSAAPACAGPNQLQSGAQCCKGLVAGTAPSIEKTLPGKKVNEPCKRHEECASQLCSSEDEGSNGLCMPVIVCHQVNGLGAECTPENPNCAAGVCRSQDVGVGGVNCKVWGASCGAASECCSGKCESGRCQERFVCEDCVPEGTKPTGRQQCCKGFIQDIEGFCTREMPPFILPKSSQLMKKKTFSTLLALLLPISAAQATELEGRTGVAQGTTSSSAKATVTGKATSQGNWVNDDALTEQQLAMIEGEIKQVLKIKDRVQRKQALLSVYAKRKEMVASNSEAIKAGKPIGKVWTQEEYVKNYNIPAITPKERSNVERCEFNTVKDNWIDSSNLMRNADLFVRAFEVSYSGKGTEDLWHLLNPESKAHPDNLYTRTKSLMRMIRDNRNYQHDQLRYVDLLMACQCLYAYGPEKFDAEKQAFFYSQCTGSTQNKVCRADELVMVDDPSTPDKNEGSAEPEFQQGREFPNYVEMYLRKLEKMASQGEIKNVEAIDNIDSGAAGIGHEEVLVRWLKLRTCNQLDVFVDTEKVETELQEIAEDLSRAKKANPLFTQYWNRRLSQMGGAVHADIINIFRKDATKDIWYRGYVHTESKVGSWTKKSLRFLLFIILAILALGVGLVGLVAMATAGAIAGGVLGVGLLLSGGSGGASGYSVVESFARDFPNVIIEDRLVEKKTCGKFKLFYCKTFYRILHWPVFVNNPEMILRNDPFPWAKRPSMTCDQVLDISRSMGGMSKNPCSGPFKATMCARSFYRPMVDSAIADDQQFAPWATVMRDRMLMDPVFPEFYTADVNTNNGWVPALHEGFRKGCQWTKTIGKRKPTAEDKKQFFPDFKQYMDGQGNFLPEYQMGQVRIDAYKQAVSKYAMCHRLNECGQAHYDGEHPNPTGFADVFEKKEVADLFANYVYQIHFKWRHMSAQAGIGYPLAYLENYYLTLLHNVRLLTTLSVRRGLEMDDAYNKYADDLSIRRSRYQIEGNNYGLTMGDEERSRGGDVTGNVYRSFRGLGFPLSAEFSGLPGGQGLPAAGGSSALNASLNSGFGGAALAAARRHAGRVAKDNEAWKNYKERTKGSKDAQARLDATGNFFSNVNAPLNSVSALARPGDNSLYSGIGGTLGAMGTRNVLGGAGSDRDGAATPQKYGAIDGKEGANASLGSAGMGSMGMGGMNLGAGDSGALDDSGIYSDGGAAYRDGAGGRMGAMGSGSYGSAGGSGAYGGFADAARMTGMSERDLKNMIDSAGRDRSSLTSGDEDSLFQKVSKAYLRNLDRMLLRKEKPKAAAPEKTLEKPAGEQEKEALKKIFAQ